MDVCKKLFDSFTPEQKDLFREMLGEETKKPQNLKHTAKFEVWPNGNIKSLTHYRGELMHGTHIGWHENGQKEYEENYENGFLHGSRIGWGKNGQKVYEYNYVNGITQHRKEFS